MISLLVGVRRSRKLTTKINLLGMLQDTNIVKELHWETSTTTRQPGCFIGLGPIPVGDTHIIYFFNYPLALYNMFYMYRICPAPSSQLLT